MHISQTKVSLQGNVSIIICFAFYPVIFKTFIMVQFYRLKILGKAFKEREMHYVYKTQLFTFIPHNRNMEVIW